MALRASERLQAVAFVAIVIAAIVGVYVAAQSFQPAAVQRSVIHFARLDIHGDGWSIRYDPAATSNNSAFGILREASATLGFSLAYVPYEIPKGVFVTAINGSVNGDGGRFWQFWVNGVYGTVSADNQGLRDNDVIVWTYSIPAEGG